MMVDLDSVPDFELGSNARTLAPPAWRMNCVGERPPAFTDEWIQVQFNDERVTPDHPSHIWDTRRADDEHFAVFYRAGGPGLGSASALRREPGGHCDEGAGGRFLVQNSLLCNFCSACASHAN